MKTKIGALTVSISVFVTLALAAWSANVDGGRGAAAGRSKGASDLQAGRSFSVRTNLGPRKVTGGTDQRHQRINALLAQDREK